MSHGRDASLGRHWFTDWAADRANHPGVTDMPRQTARYVAPLAALALLTGCGMAETTATTAAMAEAKAQEAKAAKETQARIEQKLEDAQAAAAQQRANAEKLTE
jgi:hypothetical protein